MVQELAELEQEEEILCRREREMETLLESVRRRHLAVTDAAEHHHMMSIKHRSDGLLHFLHEEVPSMRQSLLVALRDAQTSDDLWARVSSFKAKNAEKEIDTSTEQKFQIAANSDSSHRRESIEKVWKGACELARSKLALGNNGDNICHRTQATRDEASDFPQASSLHQGIQATESGSMKIHSAATGQKRFQDGCNAPVSDSTTHDVAKRYCSGSLRGKGGSRALQGAFSFHSDLAALESLLKDVKEPTNRMKCSDEVQGRVPECEGPDWGGDHLVNALNAAFRGEPGKPVQMNVHV
jgi:hypothetical protein